VPLLRVATAERISDIALSIPAAVTALEREPGDKFSGYKDVGCRREYPSGISIKPLH
jgi:hypothetical protein